MRDEVAELDLGEVLTSAIQSEMLEGYRFQCPLSFCMKEIEATSRATVRSRARQHLVYKHGVEGDKKYSPPKKGDTYK